ncbi:hypothetical protein RIVM261_052080 [Rivularia sp. IAM M-261]|nr:hypothetical protein CAL7716_005440 [Calothrix sp. PCC 7716]GJD20252.1 hypothetical protein RIVM261_052080 [Rivularia sp. IAM M-261]
MSITKITDKLRDFNLITEETYQKVKQLIESSDITRSTLIYEVQQDATNASHGIFTPTNITFEWKSETIAELALTFNDKRYSTKLKFRGESWDDNKFFAFLQQIIEENNSEGKFYPVYETSYPIGYIFLNDFQKTLLEQDNIFNFSRFA